MIVQQPGRELLRLASRVDTALGQMVKARASAGLGSEWEASRHAWALSNLVLRHSEAVVVMARTDVVLLPGSWAAARASMEIAARVSWLLSAPDEWEGENRWLALLEEGARFDEAAEQLIPHDQPMPKSAQIREFVAAVRAKLPPERRAPVKPMPLS